MREAELFRCTFCGCIWLKHESRGEGYSLADEDQKPCIKCDNGAQFLSLIESIAGPIKPKAIMTADTPPPSTAAHKLYISLPEGVAPPPGFKTSSYDSDISKWIYQRIPTAWSCASEAAGNPRCGGWCYNESRCTASFVEVPGLDVIHDSDRALHNAPAFPVGPCNCSVSKPSTAASEPIIETLRRMADTAYCQMIVQAKRTECLGWEIKVHRREFGTAEFEAHEKRCELYGRHLGLSAAIAELSRLSAGEGEKIDGQTVADLVECLRDWPDMCAQYSTRAADLIERLSHELAAANAKLAAEALLLRKTQEVLNHVVNAWKWEGYISEELVDTVQKILGYEDQNTPEHQAVPQPPMPKL